WFAVVHQVAAALEESVAHEFVRVERGGLEYPACLEQIGAAGNETHRDQEISSEVGLDVANGPHVVVPEPADGIPRAAWTEERQDQVRPVADAPEAQR